MHFRKWFSNNKSSSYTFNYIHNFQRYVVISLKRRKIKLKVTRKVSSITERGIFSALTRRGRVGAALQRLVDAIIYQD